MGQHLTASEKVWTKELVFCSGYNMPTFYINLQNTSLTDK